MKLTETQYIAKYNELYDKAQVLIDKYKPCIKDGKLRCQESGYNEVTRCCGRCKYHTTNGCTMRSLSCKMWVCHKIHMDPKLKTFHKKMMEIENEASEYRMKGMRDNVYDCMYFYYTYE